MTEIFTEEQDIILINRRTSVVPLPEIETLKEWPKEQFLKEQFLKEILNMQWQDDLLGNDNTEQESRIREPQVPGQVVIQDKCLESTFYDSLEQEQEEKKLPEEVEMGEWITFGITKRYPRREVIFEPSDTLNGETN